MAKIEKSRKSYTCFSADYFKKKKNRFTGHGRVGNFYPCAVLTMVKTPVKTGFGKTPKTHISWAKFGKTNFLNLRMLVVFRTAKQKTMPMTSY